MTTLSARMLVEQQPANDTIHSTDIVPPVKRVFCDPVLPPNWLARPATIITDYGWIVGTARKSRTPSRPANGSWRYATMPFVRMQATKAHSVGMP